MAVMACQAIAAMTSTAIRAVNFSAMGMLKPELGRECRAPPVERPGSLSGVLALPRCGLLPLAPGGCATIAFLAQVGGMDWLTRCYKYSACGRVR